MTQTPMTLAEIAKTLEFAIGEFQRSILYAARGLYFECCSAEEQAENAVRRVVDDARARGL